MFSSSETGVWRALIVGTAGGSSQPDRWPTGQTARHSAFSSSRLAAPDRRPSVVIALGEPWRLRNFLMNLSAAALRRSQSAESTPRFAASRCSHSAASRRSFIPAYDTVGLSRPRFMLSKIHRIVRGDAPAALPAVQDYTTVPITRTAIGARAALTLGPRASGCLRHVLLRSQPPQN